MAGAIDVGGLGLELERLQRGLVDVDRRRGDGRLVGLPVVAQRCRHDGDRQRPPTVAVPIAPAANVGRRLVPR